MRRPNSIRRGAQPVQPLIGQFFASTERRPRQTTLYVLTCTECGTEFGAKRATALTCSDDCRRVRSRRRAGTALTTAEDG